MRGRGDIGRDPGATDLRSASPSITRPGSGNEPKRRTLAHASAPFTYLDAPGATARGSWRSKDGPRPRWQALARAKNKKTQHKHHKPTSSRGLELLSDLNAEVFTPGFRFRTSSLQIGQASHSSPDEMDEAKES